MNTPNTLETLRAALDQNTEVTMNFAQGNPYITGLSPSMVHSAMKSNIHDPEIFYLAGFNDPATNYCLSRLAQHLGVREGIQEQFKFEFLDGEEPSEELKAVAELFLVNVTPNSDFPASYWDAQISDVLSMNAEMHDPEEFEDEPELDLESEHAIAAPPMAQAQVKTPCRDWMATKSCKFGDRCRFAHEPVAVVAAGGGASRQPCREWAQGKCKWGDKCRYSHAVPS